MSLSDGTPMMTMPVAPANGGNSGGFGWGGDGAWLIILFLIFAVFGWGGNGWGNNYSRDGAWQSGMRGAYDRDMSNARRGTHYVRGHYSRDGGMENMKRQLQEMLDNADDESIRRAIQRCMDTIEG